MQATKPREDSQRFGGRSDTGKEERNACIRLTARLDLNEIPYLQRSSELPLPGSNVRQERLVVLLDCMAVLILCACIIILGS